MSISAYENSFPKISDAASDKRISIVTTASLFSLFIHIILGWYCLHIINDVKVQIPRQSLEFRLVMLPDPVFTPPQPLPISPTPRAITPPVQPKPAKKLSAPKPAVPKSEPVKESVKPAEVIDNRAEAIQPSLPSPPPEETTDRPISSKTEAIPVAPPTSEESGDRRFSDAAVVNNNIPGGSQGDEHQVIGPVFDADYLNNPVPPYPAAARKLKLQGTVIVRVLVSPQGKPEIIQLAESSGISVLDGAALKAVKDWSFVPAREGENPVAAWVDVPIRFRLN